MTYQHAGASRPTSGRPKRAIPGYVSLIPRDARSPGTLSRTGVTATAYRFTGHEYEPAGLSTRERFRLGTRRCHSVTLPRDFVNARNLDSHRSQLCSSLVFPSTHRLRILTVRVGSPVRRVVCSLGVCSLGSVLADYRVRRQRPVPGGTGVLNSRTDFLLYATRGRQSITRLLV